ncbi:MULTISPECIES: phage minor capsid protein [Rhodococcus]|uniref:phage minor capsid protein n=1 Tax=Rhodococcus TaxID=1827 RepID=UPI000C7C61D8|nr:MULTISPECIES: phage minor capsid protein [Rhodococcus]AUM18235.1 minor capsid protein [Rhodococcus ruber]
MTAPDPGASAAIASIYADAESHLIALIAKYLEQGLDAPDWAIRQVQDIGRLSAAAQGLLSQLSPIVAATIDAAVAQQIATGVSLADAEITDARFVTTAPAAASVTVVDTAAVAALAAETAQAVIGTHHSILSSTMSAYRQIIAEATGRSLTGVQTRQQVLQTALNRFAREGLTGFTDRAGRRWRPDTYADMALRTSAFRAQTAGHQARLRQRGFDLVVVSHHRNPSPQCAPFEGKVLSLSGSTPNGEHRVDGVRGRTTVKVTASLDEARSKGFQHPNCRHRYTLLVPGARIPKPEPYDPQGYKDEQRLRYLERKVREAKRLEAAALSDADKRLATARVRAIQGQIRDHVDRTGVARKRFREQARQGNPAA